MRGLRLKHKMIDSKIFDNINDIDSYIICDVEKRIRESNQYSLKYRMDMLRLFNDNGKQRMIHEVKNE